MTNFFLFPKLNDDADDSTTKNDVQHETIDVAIVGGGVSGIFSAMRLKEDNPKLNVAVYESSDEVGGRLVSIPTPKTDKGLIAEYGGMQFPSSFRYTNAVVNDFSLEKVDMPISSKAKLPSFAQRLVGKNNQVSKSVNEANASKKLFVTLLAHLGWKESIPTDDAGRQQLRRYLQDIGLDENGNVCFWSSAESLSGMSIHQLWLRVYGYKGLEYQQAVSGHYSPWGEWNAIDAIMSNLSDFGSDVQYFKLKDGYQSMVTVMAGDFKKLGGKIHVNHTLDSIVRRDDAFLLEFSRGETSSRSSRMDTKKVVANKVILAMPRKCLSKINSPILEKRAVRKMIESVKPKPFFKLFLCYKEAWWTNKRNKIINLRSSPVADESLSSTCGQCFNWQVDSTSGRALVTMYDEETSPESWDSLLGYREQVNVQHSWEGNKAPDTLKEEAHCQFVKAQNMNLKDVPKPYDAGYASWTDETRFGGGMNCWLPNVDSQAVMKSIVQPNPDMPLFICGSAYSNYQGWVEGALETADTMLTKHFGLRSYMSPLESVQLRASVVGRLGRREKAQTVFFEMTDIDSGTRIYQPEEKSLTQKHDAIWKKNKVMFDKIKDIKTATSTTSKNIEDVVLPLKLSFHIVEKGRHGSERSVVESIQISNKELMRKAECTGCLLKTSRLTVEFVRS